MNKKEELIKKVDQLCKKSGDIYSTFFNEDEDAIINTLKIDFLYQEWYTEACFVIKQIMPDRLQEFTGYYDSKIHYMQLEDISPFNYSICDYLSGLRLTSNGEDLFDHQNAAFMKFLRQSTILKAAQEVLNSSLKDMNEVLRAELYDNELLKARDLHENNYLRPAGIIAAVVLEGHLRSVCLNNNVEITKKDPTIAVYNDALKKHGIIDTKNWRWIQVLGDIRNICGHNTGREPTADEVLELIDGVDKAIRIIA